MRGSPACRSPATEAFGHGRALPPPPGRRPALPHPGFFPRRGRNGGRRGSDGVGPAETPVELQASHHLGAALHRSAAHLAVTHDSVYTFQGPQPGQLATTPFREAGSPRSGLPARPPGRRPPRRWAGGGVDAGVVEPQSEGVGGLPDLVGKTILGFHQKRLPRAAPESPAGPPCPWHKPPDPGLTSSSGLLHQSCSGGCGGQICHPPAGVPPGSRGRRN